MAIGDGTSRVFHGLQWISRIEAELDRVAQGPRQSGRQERLQRTRRTRARAAQLIHQQVEPLCELELLGVQVPGVVVEQLVSPALDFLGQALPLVGNQPRTVFQRMRDLGQQLETDLGMVVDAQDQVFELAIHGPRAGFADRHQCQDPIKDRSRKPPGTPRRGRGADHPSILASPSPLWPSGGPPGKTISTLSTNHTK